MSFTRDELEGYRDATVPDLIGPGLTLLFVGINPGLWTAATGTHFAHPGNRFYPALLEAGLIDREIDRRSGFTPADREHIVDRGIGITNIASRATVRASELSTAELREGASVLVSKVARCRPMVVAIAGITAYRSAFEQRNAVVGEQPGDFGSATLWVVPNPSGLNAHETTSSLADWYRRVGKAAGIVT